MILIFAIIEEGGIYLTGEYKFKVIDIEIFTISWI